MIWVLLLCISALAMGHAYVFYPLWWMFLGPKRTQSTPQELPEADLPKVSVIVAAYNEAAFIGPRVTNLLAMTYPSDRLEIIIASDGSSDETVKIAEAAAGPDPRVKVVGFQQRRGKVGVLNEVCAQVTGDVLVFSDANVDFAPDAILKLVYALRQEGVGCVCGKLKFRTPKDETHAQTEGIYWKLETWLKEREGAEGVLLGANGAIYAMHRRLWQSCPPDTLIEDFLIPMRLLMSGWKVEYVSSAVAWEDLPPTLKDEFGRRIRIGAGDFQTLSRCFSLLNPAHGLAAWVFFSHKVLRWLGPFFMLLMLLSALVLTINESWLGRLALVLQLMAYAAALVGLFMPRGTKMVHRLCGAGAHFVSMNAALFLGFFRWLSRTQNVTWKRTAR